MVQITTRVQGAKIVRQGFEGIAKDTPKIGRLRIFRTLQSVIRAMKVYPSPRIGSSYVRTFRLRRAWQLKRVDDTGYRISNNARYKGKRYGKYVVGDSEGQDQAWMHVGRWNVMRKILDQAMDLMWDDFNKDMKGLIRLKGFNRAR